MVSWAEKDYRQRKNERQEKCMSLTGQPPIGLRLTVLAFNKSKPGNKEEFYEVVYHLFTC